MMFHPPPLMLHATFVANDETNLPLSRTVSAPGCPDEGGKEKEAVRMLKCCMLCGKCSIVCPRGINTRHLILSICKLYKED